jgi:hypothetical protein
VLIAIGRVVGAFACATLFHAAAGYGPPTCASRPLTPFFDA